MQEGKIQITFFFAWKLSPAGHTITNHNTAEEGSILNSTAARLLLHKTRNRKDDSSSSWPEFWTGKGSIHPTQVVSPIKEQRQSRVSYLSWSCCAFFAEPRADHVPKLHLRKNTIHSRKLSAAYSNQSAVQLHERCITNRSEALETTPSDPASSSSSSGGVDFIQNHTNGTGYPNK